MRPTHLLSAALLTCLLACVAELSSTLQIDGSGFVPTSCNSGELNNFMGVDLIDDSGRMLRLVQSPANQPSAILIDGADVTELGPCGQMAIQRQNSTVNDITNVEGSATLECKSEAHSITGTVAFKNCH